MIRTYSARQSAGLGCAERGPLASPGLMAAGSPAYAPARAHLRAVGAKLAGEGPWAR